MAKQRIVNTHFWRDSYILSLKPDERLMFLWVITNPATDLCGAYEAALSTIELETGLKGKRILEILAKFFTAGKVLYRDGWVLIKNFSKHQHGSSPKVALGAERSLNACPDWVKDTLVKGIDTVSIQGRTLTLTSTLTSSEPEPHGTYDAGEIQDWEYPMKEIIEAFPDYLPDRVTSAMIGFFKAEVLDTPIDRAAWSATIRDYQMNFNVATKSYLPEKTANVLSVFRKHKAELEKNGTKSNSNKQRDTDGGESTEEFLRSIGSTGTVL
jgi:hypothetical protein